MNYIDEYRPNYEDDDKTAAAAIAITSAICYYVRI